MLLASMVLVCSVMAPVAGGVSKPFSPPRHLGVDIAASAGTPVTAVASGRVHFAGTVAGNRAVTVAAGGGELLSYSYLSIALVQPGDDVAAGQVIGLSGYSHGVEAVHFSARRSGTYVDPMPWLGCRRSLTGKLRLLPPRVWAYPPTRAPRTSRRNVRPAPSGPPGVG